jgi:MFS transporter, CP family, cyanate transporter
MFTISYSTAVVVPTISGVLWDLTGMPAIAFAPMALCAVMIAALAPTLPIRSGPPQER